MKFCPKCGSILKVMQSGEKKVLACSCGHNENSSSILKISGKANDSMNHKRMDVVERNDSTHPITQVACPKCDNDKAEYWTQQVGPSDEAETIIYRCTKCKHSWREEY